MSTAQKQIKFSWAILFLMLAVTVRGGIVNIDFNGVRNVPGPDVPGPTYSGPGPTGGGTNWNGILADSRMQDGTSDDDNLTVSGNNLADDQGVSTTVSFTVGPVGGDVCCAAPVTDPTDPLALFNDYIFNNSAGNSAGDSPFTISGLGPVSSVDLYFYLRSGSVTLQGGAATPFADNGNFTSANTTWFKDVPVTDGKITGTMGGGVAVMWGLSINSPQPFPTPSAPSVKSTAPSGNAVQTNAIISVQLQDSATQVATNTIQLFLNGQQVTPTVASIPGTNVTAVTYDPKGALLVKATNAVRIIFSSNASPPVTQTNEFSFFVISDQEAALVVNIDFNGLRPDDTVGPTFVGQGAAGSGTVWNGLIADSTSGDDNLTVTGMGLLDSIGTATPIGFTISPVGGDNNGAGTDPNAPAALFGDYVFVASAGQTNGTADFKITGLGDVPAVTLYFYFGANGDFDIPGASASDYGGTGSFTRNNTRLFRSVPVSGGTVSGKFGKGAVAILNGLTIDKPGPGPFVKSTAPSGNGVLSTNGIAVELLDYQTQVATNSIQLFVNGQQVAPTISKPGGTNLTEIQFQPATRLPEGTNVVRVVFGDNATPSVLQTNDFTFGVINEVKAAEIVNIDFNGARNSPGPDVPGPTYSGQGAGGGGPVWNGILVDSRLADGTDEDNLTAGGTNLVNSLGGPTTISFTVTPVGGDVGGAPTTDPTSSAALFSDYFFNNSAANNAGQSPFTISGLGNAPIVDLYFYKGPGSISITGATASAISAAGIFTTANTTVFKNVPVQNGSINGSFGPGVTVINGMSIVGPLPQPLVTSTSPSGTAVPANTPIQIQIKDYVAQVETNSIQLILNGQPVTPTITKAAGSDLTTITFQPGALPPDLTNQVRLTFNDTSAVSQTNTFTFAVLNTATAAKIINIDFDGARNVPGPRGPGPTYVGQGAAGGGTTFNGIKAISQLDDGTDDDNITVGGTNLVNSVGGATAVGFTVSPVGGDDAGAPDGTDPSSSAALFGDYVFNNSAGNTAGQSPFTISGLDDVPTVDLYFYKSAGTVSIAGVTSTPYAASGIFTPANTTYFKSVPVTAGAVSGNFGPSTTVIDGLTIVLNSAQTEQPSLTIAHSGQDLMISWTGGGTLQSAATINGPWTDIANATSPHTVAVSGLQQFYRLKQ